MEGEGVRSEAVTMLLTTDREHKIFAIKKKKILVKRPENWSLYGFTGNATTTQIHHRGRKKTVKYALILTEKNPAKMRLIPSNM